MSSLVSMLRNFDAQPEEDRRRLGVALEKLKQKHRAVLVLVMAGRAYEDMATELNIPIGTVKSRINRAKAELEKLEPAPAEVAA